MRDVATIKERCPQVLSWGGVTKEDPESIMRVGRDSSCLEKLAE
jgi:hypothetical protein